VAFRPYLGVATTLLARTLFTMCSYTSITAAATSLGTPEAAAHQVTLQLFWFLSCRSLHCIELHVFIYGVYEQTHGSLMRLGYQVALLGGLTD
jgi:hypothetical protein